MKIPPDKVLTGFSAALIAWQRLKGRHGLPWQGTRDPYAVWLSEIMLQQTQVATVIPYYRRFLARFPDVAALAAAPEDEVLALWSGLGYYARARNLHRAAQAVLADHGGIFPRGPGALCELPGIGRSTAAAVCVFAYGQRHAILDGNVKRVLARHFAIEGHPGEKPVENALWALAEKLLPVTDIEAYTQGLMDLGAGVCTRARPRCGDCPLNAQCLAKRDGRTAELPARRVRAPLPERESVLLVLLRDGEVLLEKRASPGVWGGLWSLPELAPGDDPAQAARARFGVELTALERRPPRRHVFTHFRLRFTPVLAAVRQVHGARRPGGLWLPLQEALGAALPAPVRKLIEELNHGHSL